MDSLAAARALVQAVSDGVSLDDLVRPEAMPIAQLMVQRPGAAASLVVLDAMMKRNLVFLSYAWKDSAGKELATGTWVLSHGRDGRVTHWTSMQ